MRIKVDKSYRVTLPAAVRTKLSIRPGDSLLAEIRGDFLLQMPELRCGATALQVRHREVRCGIEPQEHGRRERKAKE